MARHRYYTRRMPTARKRHSVTEAPSVEAASNALRSAVPGERIDLGELVVLGAQRKLDALSASDARRNVLLQELAGRVLRGDSGIDPVAAAEVRCTGWTRGG